MPKEVIHDQFDGNEYRVLDDGGGEKREPFVGHMLQIGWDRTVGNVEVATLAGGDYDESTSPRPGYFVHLDRHGINRLIRTLRKARDQALGADA